MRSAPPKNRRKAIDHLPGHLPPRMRVLYVTTPQRTGSWLAEAFATDSASDVVLEEALGLAEGVGRLREEVYDAVLVGHDHEQLDALELLAALRAGGSTEPLVVLGAESEQEMAALVYEAGGDAYVCVHTTTTRTLIWTVARAIERHQLLRENSRLAASEEQRLQKDRDEAQRLLDQQRELVRELDGDASKQDDPDEVAGEDEPAVARCPLPAPLVGLYRDLLRTYVIMGSGTLAGEMEKLASLLATAGISARRTLDLHLVVLEELIRGLGNRSTRHVIARANLLVLEVMVHLAEGYRARYQARVSPPRQLKLPGFDREPPEFVT